MAKCKQTPFAFPSCKSRKVHADFAGGNITSFGGAMLLKQADRQLGLIRSAAQCIPDSRREASVTHSIREMLAQRVFAIACGEEDLNDHGELRSDIAMQTAVGTDRELASPSKIDGAKHAWAILALLVKRIRKEWPEVKIIFRGDSGFCRWKMLRRCDRHGVDYIIGLAKNKRLEAMGAALMDKAEACCPRRRKNNGGRWRSSAQIRPIELILPQSIHRSASSASLASLREEIRYSCNIRASIPVLEIILQTTIQKVIPNGIPSVK